VRIAPLLLATLIGLTGCGSQKPAAQGEHHYQLTGKVVALNAKNDTATIDAAAIPNFMEAMTMEYPIKSKADFSACMSATRLKRRLTFEMTAHTISRIFRNRRHKA
jgi:Cu/Ag efflux protein CusF